MLYLLLLFMKRILQEMLSTALIWSMTFIGSKNMFSAINTSHTTYITQTLKYYYKRLCLGVSYKVEIHGCTDEQEQEASRQVVDSTRNQTSNHGVDVDQLRSAIQDTFGQMDNGNLDWLVVKCIA